MGFSSEIEKLERRWQENPLGLTFVPFAEALRKAGEPARALELLEAGLSQHPNYVPAHIVRGRCHLDVQSNDQAELAFLRVTELDPENIIALKSLAELSERVGRVPEAIQRLEMLLDIDRTNEDARAQLDRLREYATMAAAVPVPAAVPEPVPEPGIAEPMGEIEMDLPPIEMEPEPAPAAAAELFGQDLSAFQLANDSDTLQTTTDRLEDVLLGSDIPEAESGLPAPFEEPVAGAADLVRDFEPEPLLPEAKPFVAESYSSLIEVVPPSSPPFTGLEQELEITSMEASEPETPPAAESAPPPAPAAEVPGPVEPAASVIEPRAEPVSVPEPVAERVPESPPMPEPAPEPVAKMVFETWPVPERIPEPVVEMAPEPGPMPEPVPVAEVASEPAAVPQPEAEPAPVVSAAEAAPEVAETRNETEVTPVPVPEPEPVGITEPEPAFTSHSEPEPATLSESDAASGGEEPELVVTETMAEIFLRQGHRELAIAVYAQLALRDPSNPRVAAALEQLQARSAPVLAAPAAPAAPEPRFDAAASGGKSVEELFGTLLSASRPSVAATVHPPAFESRRRPLGEPTRPAEEALSLSAVFGDEGAPAGPAGAPARSSEPSFDEFFAPTTGPATEVELPKAPVDTSPAQVPEDLEQFNAWLRGLKR